MTMFKKLSFFTAPLILMGAASAAATGCDGDLAKQCGLECPAEGILQGNASISGIQNVDAFFSSTVNFAAQANLVAEGIDAELKAIAKSVGAAEGATGAEIAAAVNAKLSANLEGGLKLAYQAPKCEISASATVEATAKCDVEVEPGSVKAECSGKCEAEVNAEGEFDCGAEVEAQCEVNGPQLSCTGKCEGSCKLEAAASCEGTCKGECSGECSVKNGDGSCAGKCDGMCTGTCEASVAAECSGSCEGKCIVEPANGKCEGNATARCDASAKADAKVECSGKCEGEVVPPKAKAECEASAKAEAEVSAECTPPQIALTYELNASLSAEAAAEFEAWLKGTFSARMSALLGFQAKADLLAKAAASLTTDGVDAVSASFEAGVDAAGEGDIKALIGYGCAVTELKNVATVIGDATGNLSASAEAFAQFSGEVDAGF